MSLTETPPPLESFSPDNRDLVEALREEDDPSRLEVLEDLGEVDGEVAEELLRLVESDAPERVRAAAAIALGPTLEMVDTDLDDEGRVDPILGEAVLSQEVYDRVVEVLRRVCEEASQPPLVRRRAFEAAVRSPKPWHVDLIRAAWAGDDPDWKLTAVFGMGYVTTVDFSAEIVAAFHSPSTELKREATGAAGLRQVTALLPEVTAIAADEDAEPELRYAAVEALGYLGDDETVGLLEELTTSEDEVLADLAEEALLLASLGDLDDLDPDDLDPDDLELDDED